jgi:hypothetical protein
MILLLIPLVFVAFSLRVLFAVKKGQIVKSTRFLKYINVIHLIAACLFYLFVILIIPWFGGRDEFVTAFFIYALFGAAALISNVVVLLINKFTKNDA